MNKALQFLRDNKKTKILHMYDFENYLRPTTTIIKYLVNKLNRKCFSVFHNYKKYWRLIMSSLNGNFIP